MSVAVITNWAPPYRVPLFRRLAEDLDAEFFFYSVSDDDSQPADLPFPSTSLELKRRTWRALTGSGHSALICGLGGRTALPLAYAAARRGGAPFILWASLWSHPRTPFHMASGMPTRWLYRHSDAVVTYGPHVSRHVAGYRKSNEGVFEAGQAVDNAVFSRRIPQDERSALEHELDLGRGPIVLYVGRLVEEKGLRYLRDAWHALDRSSGEQLVLAGSGPLAELFRSEPDARLVGRLDREKLPALYSLASVLVLPSIRTRTFLEPWGLVTNEAMNQGVPVVASESVGAVAGGLVQDQRNGLVVPERDSPGLASALEMLLGDSERCSMLGERAREDVSSYTYDRALEGFEQAIAYARCK